MINLERYIPQKISRILSLIRFEPFDVSTPEGKNNERYRRAALTTVTSIIAKAVSVLTAFITVPLTLNYLGAERYGLWMTISSVIVILGFADLGLGNGLINAISQADGKKDIDSARKAVSNTFFMLLGAAIFILACFVSVYPLVPWSRVFNVYSQYAIHEAGPATAVFVGSFLLGLPLGVAQKIQFGYQEGYLNNYWQIAANLIGLLVICLVVSLNGGLPWLVFALSGVPILVMFANCLFLFKYRYPSLIPRWSNFSYKSGKTMFGAGLIFMSLSMVNIIGTSVDNFIIAQFLGASEVATYSVVQRLFSLMTLVQFITVPFWPAFSEAIARSDYSWVRRTFNYGMGVAISLTFVIGVFFLGFGGLIIDMWAGPQVSPTSFLMIGCASFNFVAGVNTALTPIMQTVGYVKKLLAITTVAAAVSMVLKIVFVSIWGSAGVAFGGAVGYGLFFTIPATLFIYRNIYNRNEVNRDALGEAVTS